MMNAPNRLPSLMFSVQMLVNTEKGDTFSFNEIKKVAGGCAGFKKSAETRSARAITAHSGNKTVVAAYCESALIRASKWF